MTTLETKPEKPPKQKKKSEEGMRRRLPDEAYKMGCWICGEDHRHASQLSHLLERSLRVQGHRRTRLHSQLLQLLLLCSDLKKVWAHSPRFPQTLQERRRLRLYGT